MCGELTQSNKSHIHSWVSIDTTSHSAACYTNFLIWSFSGWKWPPPSAVSRKKTSACKALWQSHPQQQQRSTAGNTCSLTQPRIMDINFWNKRLCFSLLVILEKIIWCTEQLYFGLKWTVRFKGRVREEETAICCSTPEMKCYFLKSHTKSRQILSYS